MGPRQHLSEFEQRRLALYDRIREKHPDVSETIEEIVWLSGNIEKQKLEQITAGPYARVVQTWEAISIWLEERGNKPTPLKVISDDLIRLGVRAGFSRGDANYVASGLFKLGIKPKKQFKREDMPFLCSQEDFASGNTNPVIWLNPDYVPKNGRP